MARLAKYTGGALLGVLTLAIFILAILSTVGFVYLTKFAFQTTKINGSYCVKLTKPQLDIIKLTLVLQWILLGLIIISLIAGATKVLSKKVEPFSSGYGTVLTIGTLALIAFYYYGIARFTKLAFKPQMMNGMSCITMNQTDYTISQIIVVLMWISVLHITVGSGMMTVKLLA